ncbi:M14 family metallopeptidase [Pedobacter aquatilis]|uniref:M14 family metallopeptidase n=1 Tax=Pedobacter aquatilis TaxID=351343 RepID=UPI0025B33E6F|nr:M14 metallopeptidase family protein [Pedobacter aquatilis]MDN3586662.1 M14 family metallopeptidase [Pedobacter aquatilis]
MIKNYFKKLCFAFLISGSSFAVAQEVPSPKSHFGFDIGDDYQLANYTQTEAYFKKLAETSKRVKLVDIGKTEEGRSQYMLVVSSPENIKKLDRYKEISQQLAHAELTKEQAKALAQEGKAVVWIDGGLHATEVVGAHQLIQTAYEFASKTDAETKRILDDVIILFTHANPDGQELVSDWYMKEKDPKKRTTSGLPRLYEKYAGHDNNRDFFMLNLKETQNMGRQLFVEWIPQIMYNHHQAGPAGTVVAGPPYRDPFNYVFDATILTSLDAVGAAMHNRMNVEGKPGYTQRGGSVFSTWYNGGLRTTTYFHNMIGLLTEIVGSPTPSEIPLVPSRLLPNGDSPNPITPRKWYFKNAIDYSVSLNYAVLGYAQRYHDELLFNIYQMGRNSIERGNKDNWSFSPKKIGAINAAAKAQTAVVGEFGRRTISTKAFDTVMTAPANRDPRGYILSADQPDFNSAIKFLNALIRTGILVQKATAPFTVAGKKYPAGSYVVKTDQAFRPHVLDMFEPQDHPNDFKYEGSAPTAPYDAAGWTLAYMMDVKFDRFQEDFNGPFERIPFGQLLKPENKIPSGSNYVLSAAQNDSYVAVNDLLKAKADVYRSPENGDFYVSASGNAKSILEKANVKIKSAAAPSNKLKVNAGRIAIWDTYGGSMASGWVRWMMEQYHYNATIIYPQDIDAGNLKSKYDVILFVGGAIPALPSAGATGRGGGGFAAQTAQNVPEEYKKQTGRITPDKSIPQIKKFIEDGGSVVAIGSSTNLAYHLGLPVRNAMMEIVNGVEKRLPDEKYYVPGSVLNVEVDTTQPANWGMEKEADVYFDNSPVFKLTGDAIANGKIKPLMWFNSATPLRSGWAWGQAYLQDGVTAFEAKIGKGKLLAFGPEVAFRAQTHGTFKLIFNQLYK